MNYTASPTREELYEALERTHDSLCWTLERGSFADSREHDALRICRAVAVDVRKMLDARPKL